MHKTFTKNLLHAQESIKIPSQIDTDVTTRVNFIKNKKLEKVRFLGIGEKSELNSFVVMFFPKQQ